MKSEWKKLDHQGGSWGLCDENDVILIYVHHDHRGWGIFDQAGASLDGNRYGTKETAQRIARGLVTDENS